MMMSRLLRLLFACVALLPASAHGAEQVLGAPSYDHATETTYRAVTWQDFKGSGRQPPGFNRWQKGSFAHIATTMRVSKFEMADRQENSEWHAQAVGARSYAVMNKDFSAVMHGTRNAYTLDHEQLHFDLAEAFSRRLTVELAQVEGRGPTREEARADLMSRIQKRFDRGMEELGELQNRYDGETAHAMKKKQQKKWAAKVPVMFQEATDELIKLLDAAE